jgi:hypothetical protein
MFFLQPSRKTCGIRNINQILEQHLTKPGEEPEEEKFVEHKAAFLDSL